jgi:hypothetical protein
LFCKRAVPALAASHRRGLYKYKDRENYTTEVFKLKFLYLCSWITPDDDSKSESKLFECKTILTFKYSETNVMRFLFNLLRIKGLYRFPALLAHPQEARTQKALGILRACYVNKILVQPIDITQKQYNNCYLFSAS